MPEPSCPKLVQMKLSALVTALGLERYAATLPSTGFEPSVDPQLHSVTSAGLAVAGSIVFAEDADSLAAARASQATAVITRAALLVPKPASESQTESQAGLLAELTMRPQVESKAQSQAELPIVLLSRNPRLDFARAAQLLRPSLPVTGVDPRAILDPTVELGAGVSVAAGAILAAGVCVGAGSRIEAGAVLGAGVVVGRDCCIYPRAVLYPGVQLGDRVVVHAGAVLGADGFGYVRNPATGEYIGFPQQGRLVLEDDVEVGANTTIDRGALEETRIGRGTKIDNLVQIGHNVQVGPHVVIASQAGISGSSVIGAGAVVAGQVGIADHVRVGEGAILGAQCGVPSNKHIEGKGILFWGTPARPIQQYLKELATLGRLARRSKGVVKPG